MKKYIVCLIATAILLFFTGCNNSKEESKNNSNDRHSQYSEEVRKQLLDAERECCLYNGGEISDEGCINIIGENDFYKCFYDKTKDIDLDEQ